MKRVVIYALLFGGMGFALWYTLHKHDQRTDASIKAPVLTQDQQAKVIVDPKRHTLITVTRDTAGKTETRATFLPSSGASIGIGKNGSVLVTSRSWGTEVSPFVGLALGSDIVGRAALGVNLFYIQRWDLGGGLLMGSNVKAARVYAQVGYNAYDNIFIGLGIDNQRTAHLVAGLKF